MAHIAKGINRNREESLNIQQAIARLLEEKSSVAIVATARTIGAVVQSVGEVDNALEELKAHLQANSHKEAVATATALMLWDVNGTVARVRRLGLLRASRYRYRSGCVRKVVEVALQLAPSMNALAPNIQYLQSVRALLELAPPAKQLREGIIVRLKARSGSALKTLLVAVNTAFTMDWRGDHQASSETLLHWGAEEIAEAFSSMLHMFREEIGIHPRSWAVTDEGFPSALDTTYESLLLDACKLNALREAETMIDGLPFSASASGKTVTLSATTPELEKSIRLGYIQTDQQMFIRAVRLEEIRQREDWQVPTTDEYVNAHFDAGLHEFVFLREQPIARLVLALPSNLPIVEQLAADTPFLDEIAMMYGAGIENFRPEAGGALPITEGLTALDVMKVQRIFRVIDIVYERKLSTIQDKLQRETLRARSNIILMRREQVLATLKFVLSEQKAEEALGYLTLKESEQFIDLQYRPFIKAGDWFVIAPAVVGKSNLMRNIVTANRLRTQTDFSDDPMQAAVADALKSAGFLVRVGMTFNIDGKRETDIFALRDNKLFVFECKNAYHPCSAHELRTSFEHIQKAKKQLDIRMDWLKRPGNQEKLYQALGWKAKSTTEIYTGIITANRAFSGYSLDVHPVRQAHELINVLLWGEVDRFGDQDPIRFWRDTTFQAADLVDYLQGLTIIQIQMDALTPYLKEVKIGATTLAFDTYKMDLRDAVRAMEDAFGNSRGPSKK